MCIETAGELLGRARERRDMAEEANAKGLYDEARRHWHIADGYRARAEALMAEARIEAQRVAA